MSELVEKSKPNTMKKNYELQGMSCGGCVNNVQRALLQLPDITEVDVHLHPQSAVISMNRAIDIDELQAQLNKAGHYTIKEVVSKAVIS